MKHRRCKVKIKLGLMSEFRRCIRERNHCGYHSPDLKGLLFGKRKVLRLGVWTAGKCVRWITKLGDIESSQDSRTLISGTSLGKYCRHGLRYTPEYQTVMNHFGVIFRKKNIGHKYYSKMPFFKKWNPRAGGSFWIGAKWIIDNLGSKPGPTWSLDIIDHAKGFVPGNLRWALKNIQMRNQRHRILQNISELEFAVEAKRRGYIKIKK